MREYPIYIDAQVLGKDGDSEVLHWSGAAAGNLSVAEVARQMGRRRPPPTALRAIAYEQRVRRRILCARLRGSFCGQWTCCRDEFEDIEGDASQDGEVLGSVLARFCAFWRRLRGRRHRAASEVGSRRPMRAHDPQQAPWRGPSRGRRNEPCAGPALAVRSDFDPAESDETGKGRRVGRDGDDAGPSPLAPTVSVFGLLVERERAGCVRVGEGFHDAGEERPVVRL